MHPIVFGIPNCDTVKKARAWLTEHGVQATFHDFKKQGVPVAELQTWLDHWGWEKLLNRQGKRPVIVWPTGLITVGFVPDQWPV
jgi:arsenate reductase-like glutaredoxin family protein